MADSALVFLCDSALIQSRGLCHEQHLETRAEKLYWPLLLQIAGSP